MVFLSWLIVPATRAASQLIVARPELDKRECGARLPKPLLAQDRAERSYRKCRDFSVNSFCSFEHIRSQSLKIFCGSEIS